MTGMPEAALAAELGLDYAALCIVTNRAASPNRQGAEHDFSPEIIARSTQDVANLLKAFCI
jgi:purine nucleoside phosphorylase